VNDTVLITGGAGFVGCNLAARLLAAGRRVLIFDNLSRPGSEKNLRWLRDNWHGLCVTIADTRDAQALREAAAASSQVFHFAAQVAVTTSLSEPVTDFDINLRGTLNLLEAIRHAPHSPPIVFTSTNKVYGALADIELECADTRYCPRDEKVRTSGISEARPLDFHSPYGCSKGGADQYMLDYARSFGLAAVVLRMSCIYGPHQFGNEDQGWVAHFLINALAERPITLYGDGRQVRDILYVDDLVDALLLCESRIEAVRGRAFNIGGGEANAISLVELLERISKLHGHSPPIVQCPWRVGDQRWFVSDTRAFQSATGWHRHVGVGQGLAQLYAWLREQRGFIPAARITANAA
jgi:CDP-paratose 2-epimerase